MRRRIDLNTKWAFSKEAMEVPKIMPTNWIWVNLPHTWNNIDGIDGGNDYYRGCCYYAIQIDKNEVLPKADQYYLEFEGANSSADVYVNGIHKMHHDGGYSTFRVNVSEEFKKNGNPFIVVAVDNNANRQVYPQVADFTFYGGLYRNVHIVCVNDSHFDLDYYGGKGLKITPSIQDRDAFVEVEVFLTNAKEKQNLLYTIKDKEGAVIASKKVSVNTNKEIFKIENVHKWQGRKNPYLYTCEVCLCENGELLDQVNSTFGCRTYEIHPEKGFLLNGEEYPLRGVSRHQDRWGKGNALSKEDHEEDMELICEMGANTIRLAHYQHDQYFYDLCNQKGMVVWAEIPYISDHMDTGRENTISQMKELIVQNYNHPSIVVWGLSNEITIKGTSDDLLENHRILNDLCHEMDPTRKTCVAAVSMCDMEDPYLQIPDVVSYNHYFGWYGGDTSMNGPWFDAFHKKYPTIPIGCSEYGCEALNWHTSNPQQGDYSEEYQAYYHEELIKQLFTRKYVWATHVWNMFDFGADARAEGGENGQNHKGLVTMDRKYKKDAFYAYKAWLSEEPFVHICGKRYVDRVEEVTKVTVYSNLPEVELFVNGKSLGKKTSDEHFFYYDVVNVGESILTAIAGDCKDESRIVKVDIFNEEYRLKEKGAILNWFDIEEKEGYYSINDKISDLFKSKEAATIFGDFMNEMFTSMSSESTLIPEKDGLMQMLSGFTVLRLASMASAMNVNFTKEQLLELHEKLKQIQK